MAKKHYHRDGDDDQTEPRTRSKANKPPHTNKRTFTDGSSSKPSLPRVTAAPAVAVHPKNSEAAKPAIAVSPIAAAVTEVPQAPAKAQPDVQPDVCKNHGGLSVVQFARQQRALESFVAFVVMKDEDPRYLVELREGRGVVFRHGWDSRNNETYVVEATDDRRFSEGLYIFADQLRLRVQANARYEAADDSPEEQQIAAAYWLFFQIIEDLGGHDSLERAIASQQERRNSSQNAPRTSSRAGGHGGSFGRHPATRRDHSPKEGTTIH